MQNLKLMALAAVLATAAVYAPAFAETLPAPAADSGVMRIESAYGVDETVARIKADVAAKGIKFFSEIDQSALAQAAGIALPRSTLVQFGNPPLGVQFLTANPYAGLDWPVRMLVLQDTDGHVWVAWTDFSYIAHRHHITNRDAQFKMASEVAASIAHSAEK
ncbi:MAG: DUF302 domain-containing protein [Asticcacaulis sp.]|nr:DUF302 domain-containing protein [Asticcacaulis sp.]